MLKEQNVLNAVKFNDKEQTEVIWADRSSNSEQWCLAQAQLKLIQLLNPMAVHLIFLQSLCAMLVQSGLLI